MVIRESGSLGHTGEPSGRFALRERNLTTSVIVGANLPPPSLSATEGCLQATVHLLPICALVTTRS